MNSYRTIDVIVHSEVLKIKKSKFVGIACPVRSTSEVQKAISQIKRQHTSASHWCYACKIGTKHEITKVNDDGEPNNSAGKPILGQIKAFEVTNILVVVVRYYGGTKLGVGGLISAYKDAAKLALGQAQIVERDLTKIVELHFKYELLNTVMRLIKLYDLEIVSQQMALDCQLSLKVPLRIFEEVHRKFEAVYDLDLKVL